MDRCNFVQVEAELSPGSIQEWLSFVKYGEKRGKRFRCSDLSMKVKKHLSALGWVFEYVYRRKKRELRYKSPQGKWFYSLATACMSCVNQHQQQQQQQIVPKYDLSCSPRSLSSESSFDPSNKKRKKKKKKNKKMGRVEDFGIDSPPPEKVNHHSSGLIVSNEQPTKKIMNRVEDCDMAAFNGQTPNQEKTRIVRRREGRRQRVRKSLKKVLQVMEKKQQKHCDVCCLCHWGGELLLCNGCPSAFHHTCLGLSSLPEEDLWFCPCCCCNICGLMESPEDIKMMMACEQCQRRFHHNCLKEEPYIFSSSGWFCSSQCNRVFSGLQKLLGCKIAVGNDGYLVWTLMRAPSKYEHYDDELNSAVEILHQEFEDHFSGRDLVEELIFRRDEYGVSRGFYIVLIERKNEPITVATMRVDKDVAEVPLVATSSSYRRSGMWRLLMDELEKQMSLMGVSRLVLLVAEEVVTTWTQRFGFSVIESSERMELVKQGMLDFVGTVMCHKFLLMERGDKRVNSHKKQVS